MKPAVVLACVSDVHCGSTVAVCPPGGVVVDDGGQYLPSKAQQWLWECWCSFWRVVEKVRRQEKAKLYQLFNGDLVEGSHHGSTQVLSGNPNAQAAVVNACMGIPLGLSPDKMFFVRGTEAHAGQSASAEERIADGLRRDKRPVVGDPDTGTASWWNLRMVIQGLRIDCAHHGRIGQRPWTKPNVTANLAAEIFYEHAASGELHPHLAIRSHRHRYVDTHDQHPTRVIQTPAFQLSTAFIHKVAPGALADIGGVIVLVKDGELSVKKVLYPPSRGTVWSEQ